MVRHPPMLPLACRQFSARSWGGDHPGPVLNSGSFDPEEIADALADRTDYDRRRLVNLQTGELCSGVG